MGSQGSSPSRSARFRRQFTFGPGDQRRSGLLAALGVFGVGMAITLTTFFAIRDRKFLDKNTEFDRGAQRLANMVEMGLLYPLEVFQSLPAFYSASKEVDRHEFDTFVQGARVRHGGIYAFQRIRFVTHAERAQFEKENGSAIRERTPNGIQEAGKRAEYMPILYESPADRKVLGLDMAYRTPTVEALQRARESRGMVASGRFKIDNERVVAIYHLATTSEGKAGLVSVILRVERLLQKIIDDSLLTGLHIDLVDEDAVAGDRLLFANGQGAHEHLDTLGEEGATQLRIANRKWHLRVAPAQGSDWTDVSGHWIYLAGGVVLSILLAVGTISLMTILGLRKRVEEALQLGQYRLETKLGEGGMGEVYRASHAMLRRPTAVKLLTADKAAGDNLTRFEREVQLTSQLTHPNTVAIFDFGHTPSGTFYYAMEYLQGLHPDDLVKIGGPMPAGRVIHLLEQVCGSLAEAHAAGLVHRDVKPANILVCERGGLYDFVKVLDFGLVKDLGDQDASLTRADSFVGTPQYMSPEAAKSAASMDGRGDIYSVGAIAYLLLSGQPPFTGGSALEVITKHASEIPRPPSEVLGRPLDADLEAVVLKCLAKDAAARFENANDLRDALLACTASGSWTANDARAWWEKQRQRSAP